MGRDGLTAPKGCDDARGASRRAGLSAGKPGRLAARDGGWRVGAALTLTACLPAASSRLRRQGWALWPLACRLQPLDDLTSLSGGFSLSGARGRARSVSASVTRRVVCSVPICHSRQKVVEALLAKVCKERLGAV